MRTIQIPDAEHWFNMPANLSMQMRDIIFYHLFGNAGNKIVSNISLSCYKNGSAALVGKVNGMHFKVHFKWTKALHGSYRHTVSSVTCKNYDNNLWLSDIFSERYYSRIWNGAL